MSAFVGKSDSAAMRRLKKWLKEWERYEGEDVIHQFGTEKRTPKLRWSDLRAVINDFESLDSDAGDALGCGDWT